MLILKLMSIAKHMDGSKSRNPEEAYRVKSPQSG
jgi:hypothetical protein